MKLYNTLTASTEDFEPIDGSVKLYVCGITPYAASHVGHAMRAVVFDVLRRYLEFRGYKVMHVENFTDIDDKMIAKATELDVTTNELADQHIRDYMEDMEALNVLPAHRYPRATEEIPEIVEMIRGLEDGGHALHHRRQCLLPRQVRRGLRQAEPPPARQSQGRSSGSR